MEQISLFATLFAPSEELGETIIMLILFGIPGIVVGVIGKGFVPAAKSFILTGMLGTIGSVVAGLIFLLTGVLKDAAFWIVLLLPAIGSVAALAIFNLLTREPD